jgi:predicted site-specific integrase-resolvase
VTRAIADWITLGEAAEILAAANVHIRPETLGRWARSGRLQSIKPGGRRYVRRAQIRALLRPRRGVAVEALQPGLFEELGE